MPTSTPPQGLLKEDEVARRLNIKMTTLRRWRLQDKRGYGPPYIKFSRGGAVRYAPWDIEAFIAKGRVRAEGLDGG
jgi:hypothetical protein